MKNNITRKHCLRLLAMGILLVFFIAVEAKMPELIFVKVPLGTEPRMDDSAPPYKYYGNGYQIMGLTAGKAVVLTKEFVSACDPAVSFDGKEILFAGKKEDQSFWQIWRMDADGENKARVTHEKHNCFSPLRVGSLFHLDDKQPTDKILYVKKGDLHICNPDGTNPQPITYNPYPEWDPDVLPNGRIVFSSIKQMNSKKGISKIVDLLAVNIDGTDLMGYLTDIDIEGNKEMGRVSRNNRIYFIQTQTDAWPGGGTPACISTRRPAHSFRSLDTIENGFYHSPCPMPDGGLLISYRSKQKNSLYQLYQLDATLLDGPGWDSFDGPPIKVKPVLRHKKKLYAAAGNHCIDTQVVAPYPRPQGRSSFVDRKKKTGVFFCLDVYTSQHEAIKNTPRGSIKAVRVMEAVGSKNHQPELRILGIAPVEPDGSFHIRVPAATPLTFQLLDQKGKIVAEHFSRVWAMHRESRGCIGCHEDRELAPPNKFVQAIAKPAVELPRKNKENK
ncbi:MAG: hypothetical protein GY765_27590 [bacterium]|nr:hypothetical protein [bacterium]